MKLRDITDEVVMKAIQDFYDHMSGFLNSIARLVANQSYSLPRTPRRLGNAEFQYFYAVDLYEIFNYARGRQQMSPSYVEQKCSDLMEMLHTTALGRRVDPDWATFSDTPIGLAILASGARISLRRDEGTITRPEVLVLSAWTDKNLERSGLVRIEGVEDERYQSADVRKAFQSQGIAV